MAEENPAAQRQTAVTAYFPSKLLLLFAFDIQQRQTTVTAHLKWKQLLVFVNIVTFDIVQRQTTLTAYF